MKGLIGRKIEAGFVLFAALSMLAPATVPAAGKNMSGGGYAVSGQLQGVGYTAELFDADNGLPTSDANCVLATRDGYIWIGGYSGVIRYDGMSFERLDASEGLTSARCMFEDSRNRLWVGTNDNGAVLLDQEERTHFTVDDGLTSPSVRAIGEDADGKIYLGTAMGISYIDTDGSVHPIRDERLNEECIVRLVPGDAGQVYGCTKSGNIFCLKSGVVISYYTGEELGMGHITTICASPLQRGIVYYGTDEGVIYRGPYGTENGHLIKISIAPAEETTWITIACGRAWINSTSVAGYMDDSGVFHTLSGLPMDNGMEMMEADYQGNLWFASSRQGVMKVVSSNFMNYSQTAGLPEQTVNTTCKRGGLVYIGTDEGLSIVQENIMRPVENELTKFIGSTRIRCIMRDGEDNLWISTYEDDKGLICYTSDEKIISYTEKDGLINNRVRCTSLAKDGSLLVATNDGLSVLQDGKIVKNVGAGDVIRTTVFLTAEEGTDGKIYIGSDGDGIYVLDGDNVTRLSHVDGLTSDVILRLKRDEKRDVLWIVTSNSIEYMKNGKITEITNFPYNNNFDIYFSSDDRAWILSSYGIFCVEAGDLLSGEPFDYKLYRTANGLPSVPTGNSFSELDDQGFLYVSGRSGVGKVNIDHFFLQRDEIKMGIRIISYGDEEILPDEKGIYQIPSGKGRIQIKAAILDYTLSNPTIHMYLEGSNDNGITATQSDLTSLEYTELPYGNYTLHIQRIDESSGKIYQEETFQINKQPRLVELLAFKLLALGLLAAVAGLIVWRVMSGTVIRRQYEEIRLAKDEAERANLAKSRFLANMSHEIRTPINTIMGMDEMILREDSTDVPKPYFMSVINYALDIRNATESLLGLINDVLDISKIESGKMHLVEQEYDTEELLRSIVTMIRVRSSQKDLSFTVDVDPKLPRRLYGDVGKIKQIVLNLLTNAVKYTDNGGFTLQLLVTEKTAVDCHLRFLVKDTGIGVKPEDLDRLFTAYERLDEEKNSGIQGTGLGLDISRQFAALMDGKLWCESVYGEGSEFYFTLEQKIVDETEIGEFKENADEEARGPYVPQFIAPDAEVLVVDDNPMNLAVIKGLLRSTKVFVSTAESGPECLEKIKYGTFNVVLLDHMMPGMDGLETIKHIREDHPDLPVYALTANAAAGGDAFYVSKGFNGYLAKPIDSVALERAIMKHLPEEIMMKPTEADAVTDKEEIPENMQWIKNVEGITVEDGIRHSGGVSSYLSSLDLFAQTMDDFASTLENAFAAGDFDLYTIKVHALKTSARIIGANELSAFAQELEDAGHASDTEKIRLRHAEFMKMFTGFKEKLAPLFASDEGEDDGKDPIPAEELADAKASLREVIPMMDYDAVEMILTQLDTYRLKKEDREHVRELEKLLKRFDWDAMEQEIGEWK